MFDALLKRVLTGRGSRSGTSSAEHGWDLMYNWNPGNGLIDFGELYTPTP
jgi:hypothetical protein